jgi:regulator of cell morphogenesis and NO signaling
VYTISYLVSAVISLPGNTLKNGPDWWDVKVTKREDGQETIGEIAVKDLRKVEVFKKYGIDFCCGGKKTIAEVCAEKILMPRKFKQN